MKHARAPFVTGSILTLVALGSSGAAAQDTIGVRGDGPPRWGPHVQAVEELRIGNVGREGEGPGEYLRMQGMKPMPDGGVAIWDPANTRILVHEWNGAFVTSHRIPAALFSADVFQVDTAGFFYVRTLTHRPVTTDQDPDYGWIRISPDGEVVDTLTDGRTLKVSRDY